MMVSCGVVDFVLFVVLGCCVVYDCFVFGGLVVFYCGCYSIWCFDLLFWFAVACLC